ncbi:MAG: phosphomannomutase/phosphoglucomutase [Candidatus Peribacter sp.]|nr:phosphomannomutase/phosphoglucomutase [Candidatus Peribacter sp.]MBT4392925.1 phosphomannomutase/phosphoglucomutase [Candidatus Peribacter sp.]MBT4600985.1 phosphomannomutase/phosphoglucomutase [Candidatus Peribacter sp.]MBT5149027.1 phosphomannomutase/phosphoglucomutase [Candidatus Peribacter sp.]MBT5637351.1 phosphomannomutase/phosphoglucomutase [Candidatus Peribacter sp.]
MYTVIPFILEMHFAQKISKLPSMPQLDQHIFRAYDIRGVADSQITEEACLWIGKAFGSTVRDLYGIDSPTIAVGRDARTHGPKFEQAVIDGLVSAGCSVLKIGQTPSPISYFTVCNKKIDGSVQITASHNPKEDNGLKLQIRNAEAYSGDNLQKLYKKIEQEDVLTGEGSVEETDAITPYLDHLSQMFAGAGDGMNIVIDSGNGVAGPVYQEALTKVGANVTGLFIEPDGTFPNHAADPSKYDTLVELQKTVQDTGADMGLAFDGDGDRVGLVDENGVIRTADEIMLLLAKDHLSRHSGKSVVFTVSNSGALETEISKWGGVPVMTVVGHSFVEHAMVEHDALLGGEQSGHFFCGEDYFGFDDALVAALRIMKIVKESGLPLSVLCDEFPKVYQAPEHRPHCPDDKKAEIVSAVTAHFAKDYSVNDADGVRIDFGEGAWAGVRQSNTSPKLSICIEARSPERLEEIQKIVMDHLKTYPDIAL